MWEVHEAFESADAQQGRAARVEAGARAEDLFRDRGHSSSSSNSDDSSDSDFDYDSEDEMTLGKFIYDETDVQDWVPSAKVELMNPRNKKWLRGTADDNVTQINYLKAMMDST